MSEMPPWLPGAGDQTGHSPGASERYCGENLGAPLKAEQAEVKPQFQGRKGHEWPGATGRFRKESASEMYLEEWILTGGGPEGGQRAGRALPAKRR